MPVILPCMVLKKRCTVPITAGTAPYGKWRLLWISGYKKDSKSYPKRLKLFNEIYIGHAPTLHYDVEAPMNAINVWNLDTGVAYYGKLSIMDIETKQFWQSDPVSSLYREEKGRNND